LARSAAERVLMGVIVGAHGVRGVLRVRSFAALPENVAAYGPLEDEAGTRRFTLRVVGQVRGAVLAAVDGVGDRDAAERLRGVKLYVARAALPPTAEEEFYEADLIGLRAELVDGSTLGPVVAVRDYGAGTSLEVERKPGGTVLVPFTKRVVPVVDLAGGRLVIDPPDGLLDNRPIEAERDEDGEE
jgi:16S rRNA processing protein RimM